MERGCVEDQPQRMKSFKTRQFPGVLRLVGKNHPPWNGRAHFFGAAAEAMRRILIENARRKRAVRHGGGQARLDINEIEIAAGAKDGELLAVHDALEKLAARDQQKAE